jgi:hypothetical protein
MESFLLHWLLNKVDPRADEMCEKQEFLFNGHND